MSLGATAQRALTYDSISSVHESENFIVLRLDKRQVMSILKTGFIKGNVDDFRTFIMRKIHEAEEGYENVDIDTGDVEEDRDGEPVYTAPQDVADVYPDEGTAGTEGFSDETVGSEVVGGASAGSGTPTDSFAQESTAVHDVMQDIDGAKDTFTQDTAESAASEELFDADHAEEEADPYKAMDAFRKKDR